MTDQFRGTTKHEALATAWLHSIVPGDRPFARQLAIESLASLLDRVADEALKANRAEVVGVGERVELRDMYLRTLKALDAGDDVLESCDRARSEFRRLTRDINRALRDLGEASR